MKKWRFLLSCLISGVLVFSAGEFLFVDSVCADQTPPDGPDEHGIGPNGEEIPEPCSIEKEEDDSRVENPVSVTGGKIFIYSECKKIDGMPEAEGTTLRAAM